MDYRVSDTFKPILPIPSEIANDVKDLTIDDYQQAIDLTLEILTSQPGIFFVGQFGSVNTPGVSDIDLLVIARDENFKSVCEECARIRQEIPNGTYLFVHPISVIPYSLTAASRVLHSFKNLRLLWGDRTILDLLKEPAFPLAVINTVEG